MRLPDIYKEKPKKPKSPRKRNKEQEKLYRARASDKIKVRRKNILFLKKLMRLPDIYKETSDKNLKALRIRNRKQEKIYRSRTKDNPIKEKPKAPKKRNKEQEKLYRLRTRDITNARDRLSYRKRYISTLIGSAKQTDKKKQRDCDIDKAFILHSLGKQNNACYYCCSTLNLTIGDKIVNQISIDRLNPKIGHTKNNSVICCLFCNLAKNRHDETTYRIFLKSIRTQTLPLLKNQQYDIKWSKHIKNHAKKRDKMSNITIDWIEKQLEKQNGLCYHSGIPMTITKDLHNLYKVSIERLDNNKRYAQENCVLVCLGINYGRLNTPLEFFKNYIRNMRTTNLKTPLHY